MANQTTYTGNKTGSSYNVTVSKPIDVRTVVDTVEDLTNGTIPYIYQGLVVNVKGTGDLYILTTPVRLANQLSSWAKIGALSPEDYVKPEDLEGYVKAEDIADLVSESDLAVYVKTEDIADFIKESDLEDYAKKEDIENFLTASDVDDFVKLEELNEILDEELADKFVSQSDLTLYVKAEDLMDYVTSSEFDARLAEIKIPENVSAFNNDAGYLTNLDLPDFLMESDLDGYVKVEDLEDYIPKSELDELVSKSDLDGYVKTEDAIDFLTGSDLDDYARLEDVPTEGSFPDGSDIEDEEASVDGYATVQDVMDYVNALLEKKKEIEDSIRYAYINGYALDATPTDITVFNKFLLNSEGDTVLEIYAPVEITAYDPVTYEDLPSVKLVVDVPDGYYIREAYIWNDDAGTSGAYELMNNDPRAFGVNPRYSSRVIDGITYYSYARGPVDETVANSGEKYKIIITKQ